MCKNKNTFLMMYHGGLMPERGIETLIEVLSLDSRLYLFLLGNGNEDYVAELIAFAKKKRVAERLLIHDAVPHSELWKYTGAADAGMITVKASWKSYYYMLPNKFFENIQSETPVICSNFPVVKALVNQYQVGILCNPDDPNDIIQCIYKFWFNQEFCGNCKKHLLLAKEELCWEKERIILKEAYERIL